jgi:glycosyltransferase involved in cell wall biosynthesis
MQMPSLTIVMPCLNESRTIEACIHAAQTALQQAGLAEASIIVADNGSTDNSTTLATHAGARVVNAAVPGYGAALHTGIMAANTDWVLFADADESYNFAELHRFLPLMRDDCDLIVGNRFKGSIEKGAMPFLHRYLGTPVLSAVGRRSFAVQLGDFNCGMRAIRKEAYLKLNMQSPGMEYASEMIAKAGLHKMNIAEVPVSLRKDGRNRKPHLKTWQDGWKHLRLMLLLSPKWLLLAPAMIFLLAGLLMGSLLVFNYIRIFNLVLDIHTLYYASVFIMVGVQLLQFYVIARLYGSYMGLYPARRFSTFVSKWFGFETGLIAGGLLLLGGLALSLYAIKVWKAAGFGPLDPSYVFRIIIPAGFSIALGMQCIVFGFLLYTIRQIQQHR